MLIQVILYTNALKSADILLIITFTFQFNEMVFLLFVSARQIKILLFISTCVYAFSLPLFCIIYETFNITAMV